MNSTEQENMAANALKGAVAGAIGVWVMDRIDWFMYNREDSDTRRQTIAARPRGLDPAHVAVNRIAEKMGTRLSPEQPHPAGVAMHYSLGVGPGALYGALRNRFPALGSGRGSVYGLGLFLMQDEALNAVSGLSGPPRKYPWQAHARGLIAHVVYGMVVDAVLRAADNMPRQADRGAAND